MAIAEPMTGSLFASALPPPDFSSFPPMLSNFEFFAVSPNAFAAPLVAFAFALIRPFSFKRFFASDAIDPPSDLTDEPIPFTLLIPFAPIRPILVFDA